MGVPNSEVGYTPAMPRREDNEVHKDMWWHWTKKNTDSVGTVPYFWTNLLEKKTLGPLEHISTYHCICRLSLVVHNIRS